MRRAPPLQLHAAHHCGVPFHLDIGSESLELRHTTHEAVFKIVSGIYVPSATQSSASDLSLAYRWGSWGVSLPCGSTTDFGRLFIVTRSSPDPVSISAPPHRGSCRSQRKACQERHCGASHHSFGRGCVAMKVPASMRSGITEVPRREANRSRQSRWSTPSPLTRAHRAQAVREIHHFSRLTRGVSIIIVQVFARDCRHHDVFRFR